MEEVGMQDHQPGTEVPLFHQSLVHPNINYTHTSKCSGRYDTVYFLEIYLALSHGHKNFWHTLHPIFTLLITVQAFNSLQGTVFHSVPWYTDLNLITPENHEHALATQCKHLEI